MKGIVMTFGLDAAENEMLEMLCAMFDLRFREVLPEEYGQPIGSFAGVLPKCESAQGQEQPDGKMLVFAFVPDALLEILLGSMKTAEIAVGSYKAVLTENNAVWTVPELFAELRREREALNDYQ